MDRSPLQQLVEFSQLFIPESDSFVVAMVTG